MNALAQFSTARHILHPDSFLNAESAKDAIDIRDLRFSWKKSEAPVLDINHFIVGRGERVFIEGLSGSGKSTLLNLIAGVVTPQQGSVSVLNHRIDMLSGSQRDRFRSDLIGFIFQMFNLIPYLSVMENVTLPCRFSLLRRQKAQSNAVDIESEARRLLTHLDIADPAVLRRPVTDLSVGQQQRVAAARALIGSPEVLIADEPTSSLDADHRQAFVRLLFEECEKENTALIFASHDTGLAGMFDRTVRLGAINRAGRPKTNRGG